MLVAGVFPYFLWNSSHTFPEIILQLHGYTLCWTAPQCCVVRLMPKFFFFLNPPCSLYRKTLWLKGGSSNCIKLYWFLENFVLKKKKSLLTGLQCIVHSKPDLSCCWWERMFTETHFHIYVRALVISYGICFSQFFYLVEAVRYHSICQMFEIT